MQQQLFEDLCRRLIANVDAECADLAETIMRVPAAKYKDADLFALEVDKIFLKVPLCVALSADLPAAGDFVTHTMVGRPLLVVRGDDGVVRTFLNVCRHRGARLAHEASGNARRFVCPYHAWSYTRAGVLAGMPDADSFGNPHIDGLIELPCDERAGLVFAVLDAHGRMDLDAWLGADFLASLAALDLRNMHPYRKLTHLASPNWKLAADGYLDGYHIGYLHKNSIGRKSITNRNTYDLFGPHARIGFATKKIREFDRVNADERHWPDYLSLVHYVFPNVSISGGHGGTIQLSRLFPGPEVQQSTTVQHQYFRQPVEGHMLEVAEDKRLTYEAVVRDEDCATIFTISDALPAMHEMPIIFGRNEPANQNLHRVVEQMTLGDN